MTFDPIWISVGAGVVFVGGILIGSIVGAHKTFWEGYEAGSEAGWDNARTQYEEEIQRISMAYLGCERKEGIKNA